MDEEGELCAVEVGCGEALAKLVDPSGDWDG
jgi:hypothetical protein